MSIQSKPSPASILVSAPASAGDSPHSELHDQQPQLLQRLHITPLTELLLPRVLGVHLPLAQDVSFHQIATQPTRDYGFVTLPAREAAMVKKKLQGTILKGERVAIENARPDTRMDLAEQDREAAANNEAEGKETTTNQRSLRKRKREEGVIAPAVELPEGRHVNRGWTEPKQVSEAKKMEEKKKHRRAGDKDAAKSAKSKTKASTFTDQPECLFQTTLPQDAKAEAKEHGGRKKTSKKGKDATVIHEFEKTTKYPTYLRQEPTKRKKTQEFDDEKGWVDEDGNVVETPVEGSKQRPRRGGTKKKDLPQPLEQPQVEDDETSSSGSDSSSDEDDEQDHNKDISPAPQTPSSPPTTVTENPQPITGPIVSLTEASPITPHPLETIFKKPRPPTSDPSSKTSLEIDTSFSFFNNDAAETNSDQAQIERSLETPGLPALKRRGLPSLSIPVTPYNPRDVTWRSQRSAAPTPDTAAPGKGGFGDPFGLLSDNHRQREDDIEEEQENEDQDQDQDQDEDEVMHDAETEDHLAATVPVKTELPTDSNQESDFSKGFRDLPGTKSRFWKKRIRDTVKEQRTRESRRRKA